MEGEAKVLVFHFHLETVVIGDQELVFKYLVLHPRRYMNGNYKHVTYLQIQKYYIKFLHSGEMFSNISTMLVLV